MTRAEPSPTAVYSLKEAGIYAHGSVEISLYEERLTRFFTREYRRLEVAKHSVLQSGISSRDGPMWDETDKLKAEHYDTSLELFQAFLDQKYMAYSMAYYGKTPVEILTRARSLEDAQRAKFELICHRAEIRGDETVLNIGCGFGSLETFLLENYPEIVVVSVTPSKVQVGYIRDRLQDPKQQFRQGQLRLIEGDFSSVPLSQLGEGVYDVVFTVGVFEHVHNIRAAFGRIARLTKKNGKAFVHLIASRLVIPRFLDADKSLIGSYFPGGRIWPLSELEGHSDYFELKQGWFVNGMNYWRTLDEWHRRFWQNIGGIYPRVLDTAQIRHWNNYFSLCKACFAPMEGTLFGNGQFLFSRKPPA